MYFQRNADRKKIARELLDELRTFRDTLVFQKKNVQLNVKNLEEGIERRYVVPSSPCCRGLAVVRTPADMDCVCTEWTLTHIRSGFFVALGRRAADIYMALSAAILSGIDWKQSITELEVDPYVCRVGKGLSAIGCGEWTEITEELLGCVPEYSDLFGLEW